jgi:hypothetical protein
VARATEPTRRQRSADRQIEVQRCNARSEAHSVPVR